MRAFETGAENRFVARVSRTIPVGIRRVGWKVLLTVSPAMDGLEKACLFRSFC
jgi:hypothetical protein